MRLESVASSLSSPSLSCSTVIQANHIVIASDSSCATAFSHSDSAISAWAMTLKAAVPVKSSRAVMCATSGAGCWRGTSSDASAHARHTGRARRALRTSSGWQKDLEEVIQSAANCLVDRSAVSSNRRVSGSSSGRSGSGSRRRMKSDESRSQKACRPARSPSLAVGALGYVVMAKASATMPGCKPSTVLAAQPSSTCVA
jgi:hypothetical protein